MNIKVSSVSGKIHKGFKVVGPVVPLQPFNQTPFDFLIILLISRFNVDVYEFDRHPFQEIGEVPC